MASTAFQTSLNYLSSTNLYDKEKPYEIWLDNVPAGLRPTNVAFQLYPDVAVYDARAVGLDSFSIEEHGFEFRRHPFPKDRCPISTAEEAIPTNEQRDAVLSYIDVMNKFLCESLGGEKAVCFDWRVRQSKGTPISKSPNMYTLDEDIDARRMTIEVAHAIHADGSPDGIRRSLSYILSDEKKADIEAGQYRIRVINIWRPLVARIDNDALAFCDRRTVEETDWETVEKV
ncbi:hypothetical protein B0T24DRAFT_620990 [Lasiosphaeria ovina]|uniref:Uncharacterized protein n=1 Tax=Lasiosphaeria ovina TaxID=92902 RepID=A0AAE0KJE1_9PEZI|nr:hypothetical protein B0T24DRAFT_620990 [Lasiosphaeria ovina]